MTDTRHEPREKVRFVTATSLFDGHDASIHIIRRLLVEQGVEVIHLGHNRSAAEIVEAAIEEDAQGIAVSSYQGGHVLFFKYIIDLLRNSGAGHIKVFGGGGGVIVPREIEELERYGVAKIYSPEDGRLMGMDGIVNHMVSQSDFSTQPVGREDPWSKLAARDPGAVARLITHAEACRDAPDRERFRARLAAMQPRHRVPVVGVTGTGGAGKSSLVDELVLRMVERCPNKHVAVLSVDPTRRRTGGALLGDRIRMNSLGRGRTYMRSLATRGARSELSLATADAIAVCRAAGFDLVFVETSGIGQGDIEITEVSDLSVYVMTSEFGAPMQLEKIEMLDFADVVAINKFERRGSDDALREVRRQYRRNRKIPFSVSDADLPVVGTIASRFHDVGVNCLYGLILETLRTKTGCDVDPEAHADSRWTSRDDYTIIRRERDKYMGEIARSVRDYRELATDQMQAARRLWQIDSTMRELEARGRHGGNEDLAALRCECEDTLTANTRALLDSWDRLRATYTADQMTFRVRDRDVKVDLVHRTLSGTRLPKIAIPDYEDPAERLRYLMFENVPGSFPYTAGVFPLRRTDEDPKRQFAGEGGPERTNRRFHYLSRNDKAKRLSVAFDSPTLYGEDADLQPDVFGKVGESGVSICTVDDMKLLFEGFDLCDPLTSVSMTINGPAPTILAMFLNVAIDQQLAVFEAKHGRAANDVEAADISATTLKTVRGTVQADILKEDQGQNTCIFSIDFALKMMGDIQQLFVEKDVRNYYSVSISGYHIAEAGANPISQLAFTLANGFTYVEYYLSRGLLIDAFAPNLSFFFSNGLDAEYSVVGRVARRIWAIVMRDRYHANDRSQKLKYHIQTSGRSLHAQEMDFNDIRTTLQALMAYYDNCNSLHTNSYDEAVTTPTEESVRRAMAIQLIISKEFGLARNENSAQGSYVMETLTDLVEEAVLAEFDRISTRGGVLGAMETGYQRGRIQEESMHYEMRKHTGELPIVGVNTFVNPNLDPREFVSSDKELARASVEEKQARYDRLKAFQARNTSRAQEALAHFEEGGSVRWQRVRRASDSCQVLQPRADHRRALRRRRQVPSQHVTQRRS